MSFIPGSAVVDGSAFTVGVSPTTIIAGQNGTNVETLQVDGSGNLKIIGTVTASLPSNASVNLTQIDGTAADVNTGNATAGTQRVVLATNQPTLSNPIPVSQNGVWTVQPGNTPNTSPWLVQEYQQYSAGIVGPKIRTNQVLTYILANPTGGPTTVTLLTPAASNYFAVTSIKTIVDPSVIAATGGVFYASYYENNSSGTLIDRHPIYIGTASSATNGSTVITPSGFFYNSKTATNPLVLTYNCTLSGTVSGNIYVIVNYATTSQSLG